MSVLHVDKQNFGQVVQQIVGYHTKEQLLKKL